ncbi:MAG: tRNA glutamyl-Q(34) synthetase GluQRS [Phycisphaeraceae bacterium]
MNQADNNPRTTRLAPSPTGALHLGNARTFMINWALARQQGWRIVLRIEDLDSPRVKAGADRQAIDDLTWLGTDWDPPGPPGSPPRYQLADLSPYRQALASLCQRGLTYPCRCTRKEIEQAQSAPHEDDHELRYPGTCRPRTGDSVNALGDAMLTPEQATATRLIVPDQDITFDDQLHGLQVVNVQRQVGDFIVATKAGLPAYQLAVVVDDARQHVTDVVRGDDLLPSTARQILLYRLLDLGPPPRYWHLPLVLGSDAKRLAKRHGDTRLAWYREQGVPVERVIGLLAHWCGIGGTLTALSPREFLQRFDLGRLPITPVTFTQQEHDWLLDKESA